MRDSCSYRTMFGLAAGDEYGGGRGAGERTQIFTHSNWRRRAVGGAVLWVIELFDVAVLQIRRVCLYVERGNVSR